MITFEQKRFDHLTRQELFSMYHLRVAVFVVEQDCPYQEVDEIDLSAIHVLGKNEAGELVAYMRLFQENQSWHIGRVTVRKSDRHLHYGRKLVSYGLSCVPTNQLIKAQAQKYLKNFYESFGFEATSDVYLEDNIPHIDMEWIKKI
ncbi:GNAT family N-acetyltransferase [Vagococcus luciliae]|uniref:Protein ElaA n=1 Tax=Vagococcus luciliae TaxID=2920380 RepID=A0ABY5NY97_9ENTE|nr:GNAT family N-acetyltransferase [Vagococcus luciliae]UUV98627.1 Protein ElaA [Vagococcus luciliae]